MVLQENNKLSTQPHKKDSKRTSMTVLLSFPTSPMAVFRRGCPSKRSFSWTQQANSVLASTRASGRVPKTRPSNQRPRYLTQLPFYGTLDAKKRKGEYSGEPYDSNQQPGATYRLRPCVKRRTTPWTLARCVKKAWGDPYLYR